MLNGARETTIKIQTINWGKYFQHIQKIIYVYNTKITYKQCKSGQKIMNRLFINSKSKGQ